MAKVATVIDTFGFFFRSYYALPQYLKTKDGFPTGLLTGFVNFISTLQKKHDSDYIIFAIDSKGPTFRNELDENYKANREAPPEDLQKQLPIAIEWINKMGYKTLGKEGYEADDMIATVVKFAKKEGIHVRVVSHDKDLYQLIDDGRVVLVDAIKNTIIDEDFCVKKYGIHPRQFIDYQALLGDSADNVPGVRGIGKVTAAKLLQQWGSLENIYEHIDEVTPPGVRKKLIEGKESAFLSKELVTLRDDALDSFDFEEYRMDVENPFLNIYDELVKYEQNGILRMLHAKNMVSKEKQEEHAKEQQQSKEAANLSFKATLITDEKELEDILAKIDNDTLVGFDTETTGLDPYTDEIVGFSFCLNEQEAYYVPFRHFYLGLDKQVSKEAAIEAMRKIFRSRVIGHNIKFDLHFVTQLLEDNDLTPYADTIILAWLVNPEMPLSLDKLSLKFFNHTMISFKSTVKKGETFANVPLEEATNYAAEDALVTYKLYFKLNETLDLQNASHLKDEFRDVEMPFVKTLLAMEKAGIRLDVHFMEEFKKEVQSRIAALTQNIHELAGEEFNINSTKQLGHILFEKLGLEAKKKTKTGYSTDEKVLSSLRDAHPIVGNILEYREVYKLFSTYVEPLLKIAKERSDHRIHTSFVQTGTATGRLSSKDPNLQNIPVKSELGANIRRAFVAAPGKKLIGIDYSQIELRFLAHFTQDPGLVDAFKHDKDIHLQTAIILFGEEEAHEKRHIAKTVNFGLLYGMGQKKLSETLGITTKEAKAIIERYFESFPTVKSYFNAIIQLSKEQGYVETLLRRRRYFDYENARPVVKAAYEREAVNTVFQGSVSDLIKLSMNAIFKAIKERELNAKILLQIHDELIFEVDKEKAQEYGELFKYMMENVMPLNVPLRASLNIGDNWQELK